MTETPGKKRPRALSMTAHYKAEWAKFSSKFRSQLARKAQELLDDPRPGGSRTSLVGYPGLCRVRAGDFRIIYAYNDELVHLLSVRRRDERTYDDLDQQDLEVIKSYKAISGAQDEGARLQSWEDIAKRRAEPKPKPAEPLLCPISEIMLKKLAIPEIYWRVLLEVKSADALLDCQAVPDEVTAKIIEHIYPTPVGAESMIPTPVVRIDDLIDPTAAVTGGPIDAGTDTKVVEEGMEPDADGRGKKGTKLPVKYVPPAPLVIRTSRTLSPMTPYRGNTARGIAQDAHYSVMLNGKIKLLFEVDHHERALLTTDDHPELVKMVNEAKRKGGAAQDGGRFVINEYRHVLVPTQDAGILFAGVYTRDLEFLFDGKVISPVAPSRIKPGDVWPGPHVGVKYTLAAGARDVRYDQDTGRGTIKQIRLTDEYDDHELAGLMAMFRAVKPNGGAVYINEARELFAPVERAEGYKRCYIGHLGQHPWFTAPS